MGNRSVGVITGSLILLCLSAGIVGSTPPAGRSWTLQWADEFNGKFDTNIWHYWNDNQWRDNQGHHVFLSGATCVSDSGGCMIITGKDSNGTYYDAGLESSQSYGPGYYEARVKPGHAWSCFWVQGIGGDCSPITSGCEFDIFENCCPGLLQHNVIWGGYGSCLTMAQHGTTCSQDSFYVVGLWWSAQYGATFYVNGTVSHTVPSATPNNTGLVRLTVESENNGEQYKVDYVRYYKDNGPATMARGGAPADLAPPIVNDVMKIAGPDMLLPRNSRMSRADIYNIKGKLIGRVVAGSNGAIRFDRDKIGQQAVVVKALP